MSKYRKLIVALVGAGVIALNTFLSTDLDPNTIANIVVSLVTAAGVWKATNAT